MHTVLYLSVSAGSQAAYADIRVSETDTWHQLKDSKRIGSKMFKMHDAHWTNFEFSVLCPIGIAHL